MAAADLTADLAAVRDQGNRGTCLAFGVTTAHEHARAMRRAVPIVELSVELLYWRCKQLDGNPAEEATVFPAAKSGLQDPGQPAEALWAYDGGRDHTDGSYQPPPAALEADVLRCATLRGIDASVDGIRGALVANSVVVAGLELWDGFYTCTSRSLESPAKNLTGDGHVVCITAFDDGERQMAVRNSWGSGWGDGGYGWLDYDGLEEVLWEAWVVDDDLDPA